MREDPAASFEGEATGGSPGSPVRSRTLRGLAWKGVSQVMVQLSRILVLVVLARQLSPKEYGLVGMALVFSAVLLLFADIGLGAALVQRRRITEEDRSTVFWTSAGVGALLTLAGVAGAGLVASAYGEPSVRPLVLALSAGCIVTALGSTPAALLTRDMDFRGLELRAIGATVAGAIVAVITALRGWGAWAVVAQQLTVVSFSTVLLWAFSPWRPRLVFSLASLRSIGGFGGNVFGSRFCFFLNRNTDNILVGRFLGADSLGIYALAYNAMITPLSRLAFPLQEVMFPALARMQDDRARMREIWLRTLRLISAFAMPAMLGLIVVADEFARVVFGERWLAVAPVLQILAWVGLLQTLSALNSKILTALDRTGVLMRFAVLSFALYLVAFVVGLKWGILGVATGYAVMATAVVQPLYLWLTARELGASVRDILRTLSPIVQATLVMLVPVVALRLVLVHNGVSPAFRLVTVALVGAAVFTLACAWREPAVFAELRRLRPRKRHRLIPVARPSEF
jgi:O-antigen/teichoic acid export membrane protein